MNLLPEATSNGAEVDALFAALLAISLAVLALVYGLMWIYMIRYRAGSSADRSHRLQKSWRFEITWTAATLLIFFGLFLWGADLYVRLFRPPADTLKIYVVGKQWMWKVEHPGGQREINALHVPVNKNVQLIMASEDVIHDFSVPAFRIKHDVLPGRYETLWFRADKVGTYRLFCTQLCGADHALMTGQVVVMTSPDYQKWLAQTAGGETLVAAGAALFTRYGCAGCHVGNSTVRAPRLNGVYGSPVPLSDGSFVVADDKYIRDSILRPKAQVVAGFDPVMPSFAGQISEDDLIRIIAYIKSLGTQRTAESQG